MLKSKVNIIKDQIIVTEIPYEVNKAALVRKIDDLQQKVVNRYFDYLTSKEVYKRTIKISNQRSNNYKLAQKSNKELILISDAYYRESLDMQMKAKNDFYSKRAQLEQLVGTDIFRQFENTQQINN